MKKIRGKSYKCQIGHVKSKVICSPEGLWIKQKDMQHYMQYKAIKSAHVKEKMWKITVTLEGLKQTLYFDFPSFKSALKFYEQVLYYKLTT